MTQFYDIDINFTLDAKGDIKMVSDNIAIKQSIRMIILSATGIKPGPGPINPIFGVGIRKYLFAPMTRFTSQSLGESIYRHLNLFEPRINVENVNVIANVEEKRYDIEISYSIVSKEEEDKITVSINQI
jgi:phage baseplate assembly protein W